MKLPHNKSLVTTIKERCRGCYTCVRECPAKAIRIVDGQAQVLADRCIGCGNCIRVCSQKAKVSTGSIEPVERLLAAYPKVAAILAPSFVAEFTDIEAPYLLGLIRALGFSGVFEVAFGADMVALAYRRYVETTQQRKLISTPCPAIVRYVEKYHPEQVASLVPIVSPMVACARGIKKLYGEDWRVVFIGPCVAKKGEAADMEEIDEVLTFRELRHFLQRRRLSVEKVIPGDFDPPHGASGTIFPLAGGLLQSAALAGGLLSSDYLSAEGKHGFAEAIKEMEENTVNPRLLDLLCCDGCVMGAGMSTGISLFARRVRVSDFAAERKREAQEYAEKEAALWEQLLDIDLSCSYNEDDQRISAPSEDEMRQTLARMGKYGPDDELNCCACGYDSCREHAAAIIKGLAEKEMCLPYMVETLHSTVSELNLSHKQLKSMQDALMHSERLASMGQLAAGIAHEVNNPLGVVLMYAHLLLEETDHSAPIRGDLSMIVEQAARCKRIVSGLLDFARQNKVILLPTSLDEVIEQALKTAEPPANVTIRRESTLVDPVIEIDRDQIIQVLTNLMSNSYAAMPEGGTLTFRTLEDGEHHVRLEVEDTGTGISKENLKKVYTPFFTTKQLGKGTGLGLAVVYGIVKMHRGDIRVTSNDDPSRWPTGTTFSVKLPRRGQQGGGERIGSNET